MSRNSVRVSATPDDVFDVLDDAGAYPRGVVGARHVRHVDPEWPAVGSEFHHAVGNALSLQRLRHEVEQQTRPLGPTGPTTHR